MRSLRRALIVLTLLGSHAVAAHDFPHAAGVDLKHLPLGDQRLATAPRKGWIWPGRAGEDGRGAAVVGPWIKPDGTYDLTMKPQVSGSVTWPHRFEISIAGDKRVFTSNDLPDHATGVFPIQRTDEAYTYDRNPNGIAAQRMVVELPMNPTLAPAPACTPGAVGILLTGVVLFNALDAEGRDAVAHETQDACQGHPQRTGTYHYHSMTTCFDDKQLPGGHSVLAGYALDGFGIYGRYGESGNILTSADLDECHGHVHPIEWDGKVVAMYHYHGTWDFPYTIGCMRGRYDFRDVMVINGGPAGGVSPPGPSGGPNGPPRRKLAEAAVKLGVSVEQLQDAIGPPPPDLKGAAARLGISEEKMRDALAPRGLERRQ